MSSGLQSRIRLFLLILLSLLVACSCAVPLTPGYSLVEQQIEVRFRPSPQEPHLEVEARYRLLNSGNGPLDQLSIQMPLLARGEPGHFEFQVAGRVLRAEPTAEPGLLLLPFPAPFREKERRELSIRYWIGRREGKAGFAGPVTEESFCLPPGEWLPVLVPPDNAFSSLPGPPKKSSLTLRAPEAFELLGSGERKKSGKQNGEGVTRFLLGKSDRSPFLVGGRYRTRQVQTAGSAVRFWVGEGDPEGEFEPIARVAARLAGRFDQILGTRPGPKQALWIVLGRGAPATAIPGTAFVQTGLPPPELERSIAGQLVGSWTGQSGSPLPRFWPMTELEPFLATLAALPEPSPAARREAISGRIRRFKSRHGAEPGRRPEKDDADKGELFFLALEERYGSALLYKALRHLVEARRGEGYTLDDLIAALEQETGQAVAPLARSWLKHPGLPEEFCERYQSAATAAPAAKEGPK